MRTIKFRAWDKVSKKMGEVREMQRVLIHSKSGKNYVRRIIGDVRNVKNERSLPKTISNLFQRMGVIIFQTFSHFAGLAIVGSGRLFRLYENPELIEKKK